MSPAFARETSWICQATPPRPTRALENEGFGRPLFRWWARHRKLHSLHVVVSAIWFITGTDTDVGKTVFTAALTRYLRHRGVAVRAVKPVCSGGREDAQTLFEAQGGQVPLEAINPWHFRKPVAPVLAARAVGRPLKKAAMLRFLRASARTCDLLLVEGAGGLLSPIGEGFDARDLILALDARPWIVCPNRLGAVGQSRMAMESLPPGVRPRAQVVLVAPPPTARDASTDSNRPLLAEWIGRECILPFPHLAELGKAVRTSVFAGVDGLLQHDLHERLP